MAKEKKEVTLKDFIEGDILKNLNLKIEKLESQKMSLENDLDKKRDELVKIIQEVNKEIDQKIQKANEEIQGKNKEADKLLKLAQTKLETAEKREQDSLVIESQIKKQRKEKQELEDTKKEVDALRVSCLDKEKKADLIIGQYNQKLVDLEKANKK